MRLRRYVFDIVSHRGTTESPSTTAILVVGVVDDHPTEVSGTTTGLLEEVERVDALEVVHDAYNKSTSINKQHQSARITYRRGKQP